MLCYRARLHGLAGVGGSVRNLAYLLFKAGSDYVTCETACCTSCFMIVNGSL